MAITKQQQNKPSGLTSLPTDSETAEGTLRHLVQKDQAAEIIASLDRIVKDPPIPTSQNQLRNQTSAIGNKSR